MIKMRLHNKPFKLIENGQKIIEIRLNDKKRQLLQVGDVIEFLNRKTYKKINVKVIDLLCYNTFDELFKNYDAQRSRNQIKDIKLLEKVWFKSYKRCIWS